MRTRKIRFPNQQSLCVFPSEPSELSQAILDLKLSGGQPVIVLIGGEIDEQHAEIIRRGIQALSSVAEDLRAVVISAGTEIGVIAEIGQARRQAGQTYPLVGIAPEELVTWPGGPRNIGFLGLAKKRWPLEPHYSHFMLVPGRQFGDESHWIVDAATALSRGCASVTILINGGDVAQKDIKLSIGNGRPVIALGGTGQLANELASEPDRHSLITVVPANAENRINEAIRAALSVLESSELSTSLVSAI